MSDQAKQDFDKLRHDLDERRLTTINGMFHVLELPAEERVAYGCRNVETWVLGQLRHCRQECDKLIQAFENKYPSNGE